MAGRTGCLCRCHSPYRPGSDARFAAHPPPLSPNSPAQPQTTGTLTLLPVALRESVTAGQLAIENGHYVVERAGASV
ncbi:hypothetical protein ACNKHT_00335 [Shigella flexneri]